ncbi:hypothetical protein ACOME3_003294 [Neoechinorhynchus agilis]
MARYDISVLCTGGLTPWFKRLSRADDVHSYSGSLPENIVHLGEKVVFLIWPTDPSLLKWTEISAEIHFGPLWKERQTLVRVESSLSSGCGFEFAANQIGDQCLVCRATLPTGEIIGYSVTFSINEAFKLSTSTITVQEPKLSILIHLSIKCICNTGALIEHIQFENTHNAETSPDFVLARLSKDQTFCILAKISKQLEEGAIKSRLTFDFHPLEQETSFSISSDTYLQPKTSANRIISGWLKVPKLAIKLPKPSIELTSWPKTPCAVLHAYPIRLIVHSHDLKITHIRLVSNDCHVICYNGNVSFQIKELYKDIAIESLLIILEPGFHKVGSLEIDYTDKDGQSLRHIESCLGYVLAHPYDA